MPNEVRVASGSSSVTPGRLRSQSRFDLDLHLIALASPPAWSSFSRPPRLKYPQNGRRGRGGHPGGGPTPPRLFLFFPRSSHNLFCNAPAPPRHTKTVGSTRPHSTVPRP